jgi:hypothetical protein
MSTPLLDELGVKANNIGQIITSKYDFIDIYDLEGNIAARAFNKEETPISKIQEKLNKEIRSSEPDPRSFINTEKDDLIRCSVIERVEHIINFGIAIYNKHEKLIHYCHESINDCCEDIIGQIEGYPNLPKEDWNPCPVSDDPKNYIEPINWDLTSFYGYRS